MAQKPIPTNLPAPRVRPIQHRSAPKESDDARRIRRQRLDTVRDVFLHSWRGYKERAWLSDEVMPLSGAPLQDYNKLGGWGATLVDSLDTLWIMGLDDEFRMAVRACEQLDFHHTEADKINVFEVTIRYLGGLLSAYELSGKQHAGLLRQAVELGEVLLGAFDTPNRMPIGRWDWRAYVRGDLQREASKALPAAELGSLTLEFTKLTQVTGDGRFYDAVARISDMLDRHQEFATKLSGLWPLSVDVARPAFDRDNQFSLGGKADSLYEYLPKQWLLLGGALDQPRIMYDRFLPAAKKHLFRRVLNEQNLPLVFPGTAEVVDDPFVGRSVVTTPRGEHLTCFVGGMVGLAARAFGNDVNPDGTSGGDLDLAAQLTDTCVWAYNVTATGIGPEKFYLATCGSALEDPEGFRCSYTQDKWRSALEKYWEVKDETEPDPIGQLMNNGQLPPGFVDIDDPKYLLRPEAIESVFLMWRLTGNATWQDKAWNMFESIVHHTGAAAAVSIPDEASAGPVGATGVQDVTQDPPEPIDKMESFWLGETLKYFYLVFAEWDLVSLDEWVFNTEAHPLRRADGMEQGIVEQTNRR